MRNDERGMKIARGVDTDNMDLRMGPVLKFYMSHQPLVFVIVWLVVIH